MLRAQQQVVATNKHQCAGLAISRAMNSAVKCNSPEVAVGWDKAQPQSRKDIRVRQPGGGCRVGLGECEKPSSQGGGIEWV